MADISERLCPNCFQMSLTDSKCTRCGYNSIELPQKNLVLPPGTQLDGKYLIGRVLGVGGFGVTYLALDKQSKQLCAIKEYFPTSITIRNSDSSVSAGHYQENFLYGLKAFLSEAETLKSFLGKPLIVQVLGSFQENGTAYYAMEYLDGVNAGVLTKRLGGRLSYNSAVEILQNVSVALQQVHRRNLLHRDVSPENIFITKDGQVKLIDFGATRYFISERSRSLSVVLKPGFAPPEQYSSRGKQGPWTDIYALAATFYYTSSGRILPDAMDRLAGKAISPLKDIVRGMSPAISEVIDVALRLDYRERFQTIDNFLSVVQTEVHGPAPKKQIRSDVSRNPYIIIKSGSSKGNKWVLPNDMDVVIGRSEKNCGIAISDNNISRRHCIIRFDSQKSCFFIKDISTNGTFSETGQRLSSGVFHALAPSSSFYLSSSDNMIMVGLE